MLDFYIMSNIKWIWRSRSAVGILFSCCWSLLWWIICLAGLRVVFFVLCQALLNIIRQSIQSTLILVMIGSWPQLVNNLSEVPLEIGKMAVFGICNFPEHLGNCLDLCLVNLRFWLHNRCRQAEGAQHCKSENRFHLFYLLWKKEVFFRS